ncbi:hypothetical protein CUN63_29890 [Pseudomonas sp. ACM7]|nr:hypothetical protein CUN63_29890 [Pseudomonas sp. ACM7]
MADGGGPPEQCRSEGMPSQSEAPNGGAKALGYLGLFQVTRCKSETASSHHRRNGYVPQPEVNSEAPFSAHECNAPAAESDQPVQRWLP